MMYLAINTIDGIMAPEEFIKFYGLLGKLLAKL